MATRSEEEFDERFGECVLDPNGETQWPTYGESLERIRKIPIERVWSVIEGENDDLYLLPGFHIVNLLGYVVTEKGRTPEEDASGEWSEVLWFDGSELLDKPGP